MKNLLVFLPIVGLAAAQQTSVISEVAVTSTATGPVFSFGSSTDNVVTSTVEASVTGVSVSIGSGTGVVPAPTTTINYSVVSENGTIITLTFSGTVTPSVDSTSYLSSTVSASQGSGTAQGGTTTTSPTRSGSGGASSSTTGPAQFTNAAPAADFKFGLGFLGFAGAAVALGL